MKAPRFHSRPEDLKQARVVKFLELRGWHTEETHGNAFQKGLPDLFAWHPVHGFRWIDVKILENYRYTKHQCQKWTEWESKGLGVWIMVDDTEEEYAKLFQPPNFRDYWKPHYDKYLEEIRDIVAPLVEGGPDEPPPALENLDLLSRFLEN